MVLRREAWEQVARHQRLIDAFRLRVTMAEQQVLQVRGWGDESRQQVPLWMRRKEISVHGVMVQGRMQATVGSRREMHAKVRRMHHPLMRMTG